MAATAAFQIMPLPSGTMPLHMALMSSDFMTFLPSMPGTSMGMMPPPGETMTWSGLSAFSVLTSTLVFSFTSMLGYCLMISFQ